MSHNSYVADHYCPSQDWDRYSASQDMPTECPVCGDENADDEGNPICPEHPAFCCKEHGERYIAEQKRLDENAAAEYLFEKKQIAEHNAKCPSCKHSEKYCFCSTNPDNQEG
jgi:hypothetical protein